MERILWTPGRWAGTGALVAALLLLAGTGTCVASGATNAVLSAKMADAAPLDRGAGFGAKGESMRVQTLQRALRRLGWAPGPIDGLFGPRTESAVLAFQAATGLSTDGVAGRGTWRAVGRSLEVRALQVRLRRAGLRPGPVDGLYGPRTAAAVTRLERARRVAARANKPGARHVLARASWGTTAIPLSGDLESQSGVELPLVLAMIALVTRPRFAGRRRVRPRPRTDGRAPARRTERSRAREHARGGGGGAAAAAATRHRHLRRPA